MAGLMRRGRSGLSSNALAAALIGAIGIGRGAGAADGTGFSPGGNGGADAGGAARMGEELVGGGGGGADGR